MKRDMEDYVIAYAEHECDCVHSPNFFPNKDEAINEYYRQRGKKRCRLYVANDIHENSVLVSGWFASTTAAMVLVCVALVILGATLSYKFRAIEDQAIERGFAERDKTGALQWKEPSNN